jgi:DNA-binding response OmpR family regulator
VDTKSNNNNNKRIMIIDDDIDITNLFTLFLESNGYTVDAYTNPILALKHFKQQRHNLIILDLKMPKMVGITLYQKIKEIDDKVIICLTTADISYLEQLKERIPNIEKYVIYKPILLKDMKNKIELLLVNDIDLQTHVK